MFRRTREAADDGLGDALRALEERIQADVRVAFERFGANLAKRTSAPAE